MKQYKKIQLLIILGIALGVTSCKQQQDNHEEHEHEHAPKGFVSLTKSQQEALQLKLGTISRRNLTSVIKLNGILAVAPQSSAAVSPIMEGQIKSIKVFNGDFVNKGQTLALLTHPDYILMQEEFAQEKYKLIKLKNEYDRQKKLFDNQVGSGKDLQDALSAYKMSKVKYKGLKSRLQLLHLPTEKIEAGSIFTNIRITAPISGYIHDANVKLGTYVNTSDVLFKITDNRDIHADFKVYEKDVPMVTKGQKIHFTVGNNIQKEYKAIIFAVEKSFDKTTKTLAIHAKIEGDASNLIPDMYITGHLHTDKNYVNTLPNDAIVKEGTKSFIFVLTDPKEDDAHHKDSEHVDKDTHQHDETHEHDEGIHQHDTAETKTHGEDTHNHDGEHNHEAHTETKMLFKKVEVIPGKSSEGYTEIRNLTELPKDAKVVLNVAYYLLADMKKEETEHKH